MSSPRLLIALLAMLGAIALPTSALAQEEADPEVSTEQVEVDEQAEAEAPSPWSRWLALSVTAGLDTPFGIGGAAIEITPFEYLAIYAGGGVGRDGVRFAGGLRPQIPVGNMALGLMLGVTGGPMTWDSVGLPNWGLDADPQTSIHRYWEMALFFHSGLSMEYRWDSGFFGRLAFGVEALLLPGNPDVCTASDGSACGGPSDGFKPVRGWAGLTVGYAFDI